MIHFNIFFDWTFLEHPWSAEIADFDGHNTSPDFGLYPKSSKYRG